MNPRSTSVGLERADIQLSRQAWASIPLWIGVLVACGAYGPLLGRAFTIFGIHIRIVSYLCGGLGVGLALLTLRRVRFDAWALVTIVILFVIAGLRSSLTQWMNVFTPAFEADYQTFKLACLLQFGLPALAIGVAANANRDDPRFQAGLCAGLLFLGALACAYGLVHHELFFSRTIETREELSASNTVSTIGFSVLVTSAFCILSLTRATSRIAELLRLMFLALCFAFIVTLQQRAHLVFAVGLLLLTMRNLRPAAWIAAAVIGISLVMFWPYVVGESVIQYWLSFFGGGPFEVRRELIQACFDGSLYYPTGHGFGSFADLHLGLDYPHNIFAEAVYELGFPGGALVLVFFVFGLKKVAPIITRSSNLTWNMPMRAVLLLQLIHLLKSGDLTELSTLIVAYLGCPGGTRHPQSKKHVGAWRTARKRARAFSHYVGQTS